MLLQRTVHCDANLRLGTIHQPQQTSHLQIDVLTPNLNQLQLTIEHASTLALAAFYLERRDFAQRSRDKIHTWFLDEKIGMVPSMRGAALVFGRTDGGRPEGVNDLAALPELLNTVGLLAAVCFCRAAIWPLFPSRL